jgi:ATP-dependent RNA helicase DDX23/PRP28
MAPAGQLNGSSGGDDALIAPSLLVGLSDEHRKEALAAAAAAKRAEDRAEQRAMERALQKKEHERKQQRDLESQQKKHPVSTGIADSTASRAVFVPKRKRGQLNGGEAASSEAAASVEKVAAIGAAKSSVRPVQAVSRPALSEKETLAVKRTYLGKTAVGVKGDAPKRKKPRSTNKKMTFKFRWDNTDDTYDDDDPLYSSMISATQVTNRRQKQALSDIGDVSTVHSTQSKPLQNMTARDWRIFRENFEITVKGGKSPPPMRSFRESPSPDLPDLHPALLDAIQNVMRFKDPSPIQRQAIPIGLQRRDLIGIAETGSGKTVAFGVPLCHYLLNLPTRVLESVAQEGPLSLIMAPTRELALQIDGEIGKLLSRQGQIKTCAIVGGQSIQQQAQMIRKGTHIIVGTPGRINECIEMAYLVLNQCWYVYCFCGVAYNLYPSRKLSHAYSSFRFTLQLCLSRRS